MGALHLVEAIDDRGRRIFAAIALGALFAVAMTITATVSRFDPSGTIHLGTAPAGGGEKASVPPSGPPA